jgi:hypothetical protein
VTTGARRLLLPESQYGSSPLQFKHTNAPPTRAELNFYSWVMVL